MSKKIWGIILIIIIIFIGINYKSMLKSFYPIQYKSIVTKYCSKYELSPYRVYSLIKVESKFNPYAKSSKGATGLMQITPSTGKYISKLIGDLYYNDLKNSPDSCPANMHNPRCSWLSAIVLYAHFYIACQAFCIFQVP